MLTRPARLNCRSCRSADGWWTQSSIRSIERRSFWRRWLASKSKKAMSGVTSRSVELWCRIVFNTLPSRTNRSSCAWSWTRSWSRTGELMCTTTFRFLDLPPRGKRKVSTNFDLCNARHHPPEILGDRQITTGQFLQHAQAMFSVIHRTELAHVQQFGQLACVDAVALAAFFQQGILSRITHYEFRDVRLQ